MVTATSISEITIDAHRAEVGSSADVDVTADGPLTVHQIGCGRTFG